MYHLDHHQSLFRRNMEVLVEISIVLFQVDAVLEEKKHHWRYCRVEMPLTSSRMPVDLQVQKSEIDPDCWEITASSSIFVVVKLSNLAIRAKLKRENRSSVMLLKFLL